MATFILVHGTFAKAAHWPALKEGLTEVAGAAGEQHSAIIELTWSGKNTANARKAAASAISSTVQDIQTTSRNEKIFILGQSHGGSAIAYFLKGTSRSGKDLERLRVSINPLRRHSPADATLSYNLCRVLVSADRF
jgi:triacylglycerol esterase/lipase EstA (alpha/beta hydrolase family)